MTDDPRTVGRLKAAFGRLLGELLDEAPERTAWRALPFPELESAIGRARARVGDPGHALGFRTLLKQELDDACGLAPAPMSFERTTLPAQRMWNARERRSDERSRDLERREGERRNDLLRQASLLLHGPRPDAVRGRLRDEGGQDRDRDDGRDDDRR